MLLDEAGRIHIWSVFTGRQVKMAQISRGPCVGVLAEGGVADRMLCVLPDQVQTWTAYREQKYNNFEGHEGPLLSVVAMEEG